MIKVYVFRHGPKESGPTKNGWKINFGLKMPDAEEVIGQEVLFLRGESPQSIVTSPLPRAYQHGVILARNLGMPFPTIERGLFTYHSEKWEELEGDGTCAGFYRADPEFIEQEGEHLFETIWRIAHTMPDGKTVVCISHGGLIEAAVALVHAPGSAIRFSQSMLARKDLKEGEGILFCFSEHGGFVELEELRFSQVA